MDMGRNKKMVTMTLSPEVVERLDRFIEAQTFKPKKNEVVEAALTEFLDKMDAKDGGLSQ